MKRVILAAVLFASILLLVPHALAAETFPARVVGVVDGTTLLFGPSEASPVRDGRLKDVTGDAFTDLGTHYKRVETGI